jgi:putative cardiolipin synthase
VRWWVCGVWAAVAVLLNACAVLPDRPPLAPDHALPPAESGTLHDYAQRIEAALGPMETAHWLLDRNDLALTARLALADEAASTLDVQYFIWQNDASGQLLASRLLAAANRGVKIRILLDDFSASSNAGVIVQLDSHPNVEVRVFNPWATRGTRFGSSMEFLSRAKQLNRRMHNKTYIADNRFAVIGGRNIGDRYFGLYAPFVQNDLDVLLAGELVGDVTASFDLYWNSVHTYPVAIFRITRKDLLDIATTEADVTATLQRNATLLGSFPVHGADWSEFLEGLVGTFAAGRAELYLDSPDIWNPNQVRLYPRFKELVAGAQREVLISSPYFIPDLEFLEIIRTLRARGVRIAILTNSLATNNHVVAHTGYKRWRRVVLGYGVEVYELRSDAAVLPLYMTPPATTQILGLHTKALVVDGQRAFVGSPNIDPRSMVFNTEIGLVADGDDVSDRVAALITRDMSPENAWRVTMDEEGWLTWSSGLGSVQRQPAKSFRQRAVEFLLNLLPLKKQA